jgi:hypothetical protein
MNPNVLVRKIEARSSSVNAVTAQLVTEALLHRGLTDSEIDSVIAALADRPEQRQ